MHARLLMRLAFLTRRNQKLASSLSSTFKNYSCRHEAEMMLKRREEGWLGKVNNDCKPWLQTRINKLWDFKFLFFPSFFVVVAGKWIESCDFCNNLSEQSVFRCCCRPTSLNSQTAQTESSRRRTDGSDTKDFTQNLTLLYNCCTAVFKQRRPSFEKTVHGSQKWCQLVPGSVGGYLEAVYRKTHFDSDFEHKSFSCKGGRFDKLQPIIGLGIRKHTIYIFRCTSCWCLQGWSHTIWVKTCKASLRMCKRKIHNFHMFNTFERTIVPTALGTPQ